MTRFAPSPTGYLHLGHVASALSVWGTGRAAGARVLLRIEDHDRGRCRPEYEQALFEDLAWLGFRHDNEELRFGAPSSERQSDNRRLYDEALATLRRAGKVYACDCTRKQIAEAEPEASAAGSEARPGASGLGDEASERRYGGRCRERGLAPGQAGAGIRVIVPDVEITFDDWELGPQSQSPARQCGDLLLRDRHGFDTYQFAVTVDDLRQGVDLVVRGQDLTQSTGRQIWLARQLGRTKDAQYLHHPLVRDEAGRKLGKRFWSEAVASRRVAGERPETLLGEAAHLLGLTATDDPLALSEALALFREIYG